MLSISDLRDRPEFTDTVADRIWRAFWKERGHPLARITTPLLACLDVPGPIPSAFVAHAANDLFLGTVSLIASDEETRPDYAPWVAALWVEPEQRERGIGAALLRHATETAFAHRVSRIYLAAGARRRPFYEARGWIVFEMDVPRPGMAILTLDR